MSLIFSVLTKKPIRVIRIRANRKKGGLASQHLKGNQNTYEYYFSIAILIVCYWFRCPVGSWYVQWTADRWLYRFNGNRFPTVGFAWRWIYGGRHHGRVCWHQLHTNAIYSLASLLSILHPNRSAALLLQVSLPLTFFCPSPVTLNLKGGTNAEMAPQIDYITEIFRPNLQRFGATFDFDLVRRG